MSYFEDVYLPRINRFGDTLQDRIQGKREHDFIVMMNKSPNKVEVREVNPWAGDTSLYSGVLQTKEYDEDEIQNYLLVPCDRKVPMGYLLYFTDVRRDVEREKPFMAFAEDPYTTAGYNRYTVVELEETLNWIVDGIPYSSPVHATGGGSGARDKNINLKFRVQFSEAGVYLPNKRYSLIMPYNEHIKKNYRVTLGGETWRVTGFDKISVSGVMYLTLEETLQDINDDMPVVNTEEYNNWSFVFEDGKVTVNAAHEFYGHRILAYYKQELRNDVVLEISYDNTFIKVVGNLKNYTPDQEIRISRNPVPNQPDHVDLKIRIKGAQSPFEYKLPVYIVGGTGNIKDYGIIGPANIFMGDIVDYAVKYDDILHPPTILSAAATTTNISILGIDHETNIITVKGLEIGTTVLSVESTVGSMQYPIEVLSLWLGGKDNVST
jgi:hypothetical protein